MAAQSPHIECFSPMRAKEFLSHQQSLQCRGEDLEKLGHALSKPHGILTRDFNDVTNRDAMVACFLGAQRVSIGTVWEIGVAYSHKKPVVVVMEPEGNVHDHVFVTHTAGYVVPTIEEAAIILGSILTPGI
jgi:nucleoside 2-deoxyribosyltransferase